MYVKKYIMHAESEKFEFSCSIAEIDLSCINIFLRQKYSISTSRIENLIQDRSIASSPEVAL